MLVKGAPDGVSPKLNSSYQNNFAVHMIIITTASMKPHYSYLWSCPKYSKHVLQPCMIMYPVAFGGYDQVTFVSINQWLMYVDVPSQQPLNKIYYQFQYYWHVASLCSMLQWYIVLMRTYYCGACNVIQWMDGNQMIWGFRSIENTIH